MQKHIKNVMSMVEFKDYEGAIEEINLVANIASSYSNQSPNYNFGPYMTKGQVN